MDEHIYKVEVWGYPKQVPVLRESRVVRRTDKQVTTARPYQWGVRHRLTDCDFTPADAWKRYIAAEKDHIEAAERELARHRELLALAVEAATNA